MKLKYSLFILLILICFGGSINNDYSLDDEYVTTKDNALIAKGISGINEIITTPYSIIHNTPFGYRPITKISYALENELFGFNTTISHIINLLLYIIVVLLVFKILCVLFPSTSKWSLFYICALFAVHPLHSEVVLSLKNREELFVALFGFLAFYSAIIAYKKDKIKYLLFSVLFVFLGFLTKLTFYPFILFIPISLWYLKRINIKQGGILFFSFLVVSIIATKIPTFFIESQNLSRDVLFFENPMFSMSLFEKIPNAFFSFLLYAKLHILPNPLLAYYGYAHLDVFNWTNYQVYLGLLLGLFILYGIYKKRNTLIGFGLLTYLIFIILYTNFPIPAPGIIAERFTFSSIFGFSIVFIEFFNQIKIAKTNFLPFTILPIVILCVFVNIKRTKEWKNTFTLIKADVQKAPASVKLNLLYGELLHKKMSNSNNKQQKIKYTNDAIKSFKKALKIYPKHPRSYNSLGTLYFASGNYKKAKKFIETAIKLGDSTAVKYYNLGACYELLGEKINAKYYYTKSLQKDKNYILPLKRLKTLN